MLLVLLHYRTITTFSVANFPLKSGPKKQIMKILPELNITFWNYDDIMIIYIFIEFIVHKLAFGTVSNQKQFSAMVYLIVNSCELKK